jgi:Flp pilus assembly protein TadD
MPSIDQPLSLDQVLHIGMEHFQAGRVLEAEEIFRRILEKDPTHVIALDIMGCIAHHTGKYANALAFFRRALQQHPDDPYVHFNMGVSLEEQGKWIEAQTCFRQVVAIRPGHAKAYYKLGGVLHRLGKMEEAANQYRKALALQPDNAAAQNNLGVALHRLVRMEEAEACYRKALALVPDYAEALNNLGSVLRDGNESREAARCFRKALQIKPDYAEAHNNLGCALNSLDRPGEALDCFHKALELRPAYAEALSNLGNTLRARGNIDEALACLHRALALEPGNAVAHTNLGATLHDLGKYDEALACFRKALELEPDIAATHWNLALTLLLRGELGTGFELYEKRFEGTKENNGLATAHETLAKLSVKPRWQGEDLQGKTLLVWTEQGLGDSLMMLRYLPLLKQKGAGNILISCQDPVARIMQSLPAVDLVIGNGMPFPLTAFDCHCPMMSLPYLFGTSLETIPSSVPYIHVPPEMNIEWAQRLAAIKELKVGLVWAGSKSQKKDFLRSIPLQRFAPLFTIAGARFINLQKDAAVDHDLLLDWMEECTDLLDTAALVQQLDLVISVDTAVAHLAGALAKPVWLLNRYESEWRWLLRREDTPWYPTMRIFRQPALHDWDSVIARIAAELAKWIADKPANVLHRENTLRE